MISHQKVIDWCYYLLLITVCSIQARVGDSEHPFQRSLRKDKYVKNYIGDWDSLFINYSICPKSWWLERISVRNDRKTIGGIPLLWCSPQSEEQVRNLPASRTAPSPHSILPRLTLLASCFHAIIHSSAIPYPQLHQIPLLQLQLTPVRRTSEWPASQWSCPTP